MCLGWEVLGGANERALGAAGVGGGRREQARAEPSRVLGYPSAGQRWKDSEQLKCFAWELFGAFFFFF